MLFQLVVAEKRIAVVRRVEYDTSELGEGRERQKQCQNNSNDHNSLRSVFHCFFSFSAGWSGFRPRLSTVEWQSAGMVGSGVKPRYGPLAPSFTTQLPHLPGAHPVISSGTLWSLFQ